MHSFVQRGGRFSRGFNWLEDKHGIAVAEKAVVVGEGFGVDVLEPSNALGGVRGEEGGEQAEEGGAGLVEVGDQGIDAAEGAWGVDVKTGLGDMRRGARGVVGGEKILDGAHGGGADGDAATGRPEKCDLGGDGEFVDFAMDGVVFDVGGGDGAEGAEADVEGDFGKGGAGGGKGGEEFGGKMETGSGCGDRDLAGAVGVNGLVSLVVGGRAGVGRIAGDVGREGHAAEAVGDGGDAAEIGGGEGDAGGAVIAFFAHRGVEGVIRGGEGGADGQFFAGAEEAPPRFLGSAGGAEEEALDRASGGTDGSESGGEDGGVVAENYIRGVDIRGEIGEPAVGEAAGSAIDDEQARGVAVFGGELGDGALGERVVKEGGGEGEAQVRRGGIFAESRGARRRR